MNLSKLFPVKAQYAAELILEVAYWSRFSSAYRMKGMDTTIILIK